MPVVRVIPKPVQYEAIHVTAANKDEVTEFLLRHTKLGGWSVFSNDDGYVGFPVPYIYPEEISIYHLGLAVSHPDPDDDSNRAYWVSEDHWLVYSINGLEVHTPESYAARYDLDWTGAN